MHFLRRPRRIESNLPVFDAPRLGAVVVPSRMVVALFCVVVALHVAVFLHVGVSSAAAQDPAAERLYREAERLRSVGETDGAVREMLLVEEQFPGDRYAPKALLEAVEILRDQGAEERSLQLLERLQEKYGRSREAAAAGVAAAEIRRDAATSREELEEALAGFRRVSLLFGPATYPDLLARARARFEGARLRVQLGDPDGALGELVALIEDETPNRWTAPAQVELGALLLAGDSASGLEILQRAADHRDAEAAVRERARRRISLHDRRVLGPRIGRPRWTLASRFPTSTGPELREPSSVAAAHDGRVLLVDPRSERVLLFDSQGHELSRRSLDGEGAAFLEEKPRQAVSPRDDPFVAVDGGVVQIRSGERLSMADPRGKDGGLRGIQAVGRDAFGAWWVLARGLRGPAVFPPGGGVGREIWADERLELADLAVDARQRILLLDAREGRVLRVEANGERVVVARGDWKRPQALAVDEAGDLYVLDRGNRRIDVFDADGALTASSGPLLPGGLELRQPVDLAVDGSGRLYVADLKLPFLIRLE